MNYYKEVTIPTWQEIQQYCKDGWDGRFVSAKTFVGAELQHIGNLLVPTIAAQTGINVKIKTAIMFINEPWFKQDMHIDGFSLNRNNASDTALNLPISNCNTAPMMWYSGDFYLSSSQVKTVKYLKINWTSVHAVAATKIIDSPTIVKINVPHHIENQSDSPRLMLSVRFTPDLRMENFQ